MKWGVYILSFIEKVIVSTAAVISTDAEFGSFEWKQQKIQGETVTGHGEWTIARLPADDCAHFEI